MKVVVVDYGLGNLRSVYNALNYIGVAAKISALPEDIKEANKVVLPGVGAFGDAMKGLKEKGLDEAIKDAISSGKPYFGMCLGLQLLFERSEESEEAGLSILEGNVKRFNENKGIKVPQIGWNSVKKIKNIKLLNEIEDESFFYFVHSYYADPLDKSVIAATTDYGVKFTSIVEKDNITAVQFHPERSQDLGLKMLRNFFEE